MPRNKSEQERGRTRWVLHPNHGWLALVLKAPEYGDDVWLLYLDHGGFTTGTQAFDNAEDARKAFDAFPSPFFYELRPSTKWVMPWTPQVGNLADNHCLYHPMPSHAPQSK